MLTTVRFLYGSFIVMLVTTIVVLVFLATNEQPNWTHVMLSLWAAVIAFCVMRGVEYYGEILQHWRQTRELDE